MQIFFQTETSGAHRMSLLELPPKRIAALWFSPHQHSRTEQSKRICWFRRRNRQRKTKKIKNSRRKCDRLGGFGTAECVGDHQTRLNMFQSDSDMKNCCCVGVKGRGLFVIAASWKPQTAKCLITQKCDEICRQTHNDEIAPERIILMLRNRPECAVHCTNIKKKTHKYEISVSLFARSPVIFFH